MKKRVLTPAAVIVVLALSACNAASATVAPTELPTQAPTVAAPEPTAEPTAAPSCPEPAEGTQLLRHDEHGYCMLYPEGLVSLGTPPDQTCLIPEGPAMACHTAVAFINVTGADGRSASERVDERMEQEGGFGPERSAVTIAGLEAVLLPLVGGQASTREVVFVHHDRLYTLKFVLPDAEDGPGLERFDRLYQTVISSFTLIPPAEASAPSTAGPNGEAGPLCRGMEEHHGARASPTLS